MSLSALAAAAALQAFPAAPAAPPPEPIPPRHAFNLAAGSTPLQCRQRATTAREDQAAHGQPLSRMPTALLHHTVIRMVDGCPVSTQVRQSGPAR